MQCSHARTKRSGAEGHTDLKALIDLTSILAVPIYERLLQTLDMDVSSGYGMKADCNRRVRLGFRPCFSKIQKNSRAPSLALLALTAIFRADCKFNVTYRTYNVGCWLPVYNACRETRPLMLAEALG
jgi:hypothetical protein